MILSIFYDHNGIKLEISNSKKTGKITNIGKLNKTFYARTDKKITASDMSFRGNNQIVEADESSSHILNIVTIL